MINAHTKIAALLKFHPDALEAIIKLNPKFVKLRNPLLRKLMAGRTTIAMAAKIGGCNVQDFYNGLAPLGFSPQPLHEVEETKTKETMPHFIKNLTAENTTELDVRPILATGKDPLQMILQKTGALPPNQTLKIINTFEPTPLIKLLGAKGFLSYTQTTADGVVETYFYKAETATTETPTIENSADWDAVYEKYKTNLQTLDVRELPMPLPMHTILETVDQLPPQSALFVYHKRMPLFLLPELAQKGFEVRIKEIKEGEVHLLIFKP